MSEMFFSDTACGYIGEIFEEIDKMIRDAPGRVESWEVVRQDTKTMICTYGEFRYRKTLYKNKRTGERSYLLDRYLGIESHARLTEDAEARILEEAVETSYRKAGEAVSISEQVSRATVKNRLHELKFPENEYKAEKKRVRYIYIDADEDHVPMSMPNIRKS